MKTHKTTLLWNNGGKGKQEDYPTSAAYMCREPLGMFKWWFLLSAAGVHTDKDTESQDHICLSNELVLTGPTEIPLQETQPKEGRGRCI